MKLTTRFFILLLAGGLFYASCTDPTTIGADLFEEDLANIDFTDTLTLKVSTERGDSALTYSTSTFSQLNTYFFGQMVDPIFGKTTASVYLEPRLELIEPNFTQAVADSFVLVIPYDTAYFYGNTTQQFGIEVYQLAEPFSEKRNYYSNEDRAIQATPLAGGVFYPSADSVSVVIYKSDGTNERKKLLPQLRLHLPVTLAQDFLNQPATTFASDSAFLAFFHGLYLKPTKETEGLVGFNLSIGDPGMYLYYKDASGAPKQYLFENGFSSIYYERFEHDYTGSIAENLIDNLEAGKETSLVQGMAGVRTKIEIPYISNLKGLFVNKAELEITVKTLSEDNPAVFEPLDELILLYSDGNKLNLVRDLAIADDPVSPLTKQINFGGVLEKRENGQPSIYRMNISTHLQEMINGQKPNTIYISAYRRTVSGGRVSLYGPKDPVYGMKINVAFTKL